MRVKAAEREGRQKQHPLPQVSISGTQPEVLSTPRQGAVHSRTVSSSSTLILPSQTYQEACLLADSDPIELTTKINHHPEIYLYAT